MDCSTARDLILTYLYEELSPPAREELGGHLAGCVACRTEANELRNVMAVLNRWTADEPAPGLADRVATSVLGAAEPAEAIAGQPVGARWRVWPAIATAAMAMVAAAGSLFLAALRGHVDEISSVVPVALLAVILFALLFTVAGGKWAPAAGSAAAWRTSARAGLVAAAVTIGSLALVSIPEIIEACQELFGGSNGLTRLVLLLAGAGLLYAALPVLGATWLMSRGWGADHLPWAAPGAAFLAAVAPAAYLQCAGLPLELAAPWGSGLVAGALVAGLLWQGFGRRAGGVLPA